MLILFDIDGTLLRAGRLGRDAFRAALAGVYDYEGTIEDIDMSGKTDNQIMDEIVARYRLHERSGEAASIAKHADRRRDEFWEAYFAYMENIPPDEIDGCVLPGIPRVLTRLTAEPSIVTALLTGNLERGAWIKLRRFGIDGFFGFGAFGSDDKDRTKLVDVAWRRAYENTGRKFNRNDTIIIGDSMRDIECARANGCRVVAVATGRTGIGAGRDALREASPDLLVDSFEDPAPLWAYLGIKS